MKTNAAIAQAPLWVPSSEKRTMSRHDMEAVRSPTKTGSGTACRASITTSGEVSTAKVAITAARRETSRLAATKKRIAPTAVMTAKGSRTNHSV